ncbi:uncharacterized protein [Panulirus ornatus]|uniref:uncharacterized protein isoform X2 n=1 Tax=Panulirus ornatus TaxID=150431 RepID=UPI003A84147A
MSVSLRIAIFFLTCIGAHVSLASPRRGAGGKAAGYMGGLLPGEVDAIRNSLINLMDILDDGGRITDEKKCRRRQCRKGSQAEPTVVIVVEDEHADPNAITLASFLYEEDTPWGRCTRSCVTRRARGCVYQNLCGDEPLMEEAFCYAPGSVCESTVLEYLTEEGYTIIEDNEEEVFVDDTQADPDYVPDYLHLGGSNEEELYPNIGDNMFGDYYDYGWSDFLNEMADGEEAHTDLGYDDLDYHEVVDEQEEVEEVVEVEEVEEEVEECGRKKVNVREDFLRIIGGREARKGEWPWQVAILNRFKETFCGGTLIAPRWILTAAHCIRKRLYVRLAEHDLRAYDSREIEMRVEQAFEHPEYDVETIEHDLALLKLPRAVRYNKYVRSACLPRRETPPPARSKCVIAGWGKERETHIFGSDVLNCARVPIVTRASCRKAYPDHPITNNHICAGYRKGHYDTCSGDSGGPLVCQEEAEGAEGGVWRVHGVTSFGEGCGDRDKYGVYTKVVNYIPWIRDVMLHN